MLNYQGDAIQAETPVVAKQDKDPRVDQTAFPPSTPPIVVEDRMVSVSLENVSLSFVAGELSSRSGIRVEPVGEFTDTSISARFSGYPLETAIKHLLQGFNTIFVYSSSDKSATGKGKLTRVLVLPGSDYLEVANGVGTLDEMAVMLSAQLHPYAPDADSVSDLDYPELDPAVTQVFFEMGEILINDTSVLTQ